MNRNPESSGEVGGVRWKEVAITAAITGAVFYIVPKLLGRIEDRVANTMANPPPRGFVPRGDEFEYEQQQPMPRAMNQANYVEQSQAQQNPPAVARSASGLTESDLQLWASELQQREQIIEQRQQLIDKEARRLSLLR
jgi:hypothetical protein